MNIQIKYFWLFKNPWKLCLKGIYDNVEVSGWPAPNYKAAKATCLFFCMSVSLSACPSVCLPVCLSLGLSPCLPVPRSVCLSKGQVIFYFYISASIFISVYNLGLHVSSSSVKASLYSLNSFNLWSMSWVHSHTFSAVTSFSSSFLFTNRTLLPPPSASSFCLLLLPPPSFLSSSSNVPDLNVINHLFTDTVAISFCCLLRESTNQTEDWF